MKIRRFGFDGKKKTIKMSDPSSHGTTGSSLRNDRTLLLLFVRDKRGRRKVTLNYDIREGTFYQREVTFPRVLVYTGENTLK